MRARDSERRRILVVLPFAPRLDARHGGGRVIAQRLSALAVRHDLALVSLRGSGEPPTDEILRRHAAVVEEVPCPGRSPGRWPGLRAARAVVLLLAGRRPLWVSTWATPAFGPRVAAVAREWAPEIVQLEYGVMAQYLGWLDRCPAPRVLTIHEPGVEAARNRWALARGPARALRRLDMWAWRAFERAALDRVQAAVVFTERDRRAVASLGAPTPILSIPLGASLPEAPLDPVGTDPPRVLFIGNFVHPPNVDAAARLIETIFPRVLSQVPTAVLEIVGPDPPARLRAGASHAVQVPGAVEDVRPVLDRAAVVALPLRYGGGMRVKGLEALAAGKALVASRLALEGLDVTDGTHVVVADDDAQFVDAIGRLLVDRDRRGGLASRARAWAIDHLDWRAPLESWEALYARVARPAA